MPVSDNNHREITTENVTTIIYLHGVEKTIFMVEQTQYDHKSSRAYLTVDVMRLHHFCRWVNSFGKCKVPWSDARDLISCNNLKSADYYCQSVHRMLEWFLSASSIVEGTRLRSVTDYHVRQKMWQSGSIFMIFNLDIDLIGLKPSTALNIHIQVRMVPKDNVSLQKEPWL